MYCSRSTYTKIGTIQRRLAWPLRKDDTQIREAFHIFFVFDTYISIFDKFKKNSFNISKNSWPEEPL